MPKKLITLLFLGSAFAFAQNLPTKISECDLDQCAPGGAGAGTWTFDGREGTGRWPFGAQANLTIERFDLDGITIRRTDVQGTSPGFTATYSGKIHGNRIEGDITMSWPGHFGGRTPNGPWSATVIEPPNYTFLDPSVSCTPSTKFYTGPATEVTARAVLAIEAKKLDNAVCWLRLGANMGDPAAQGFLAAFLYKGVGIEINYPEALAWAQKAADKGNYVGERCLSLMYANGNAVPKDQKKSEYWRAKAEQDKLFELQAEQQAQAQRNESQLQAQRAQAQQSQAQFRQNAQGLMMLGLILGALSSGSDMDSPTDAAWERNQEQRRQNMDRCGDPFCH